MIILVERPEYDWIFGNYSAAYGPMEFSLFENFEGDFEIQRECIKQHFGRMTYPLNDNGVVALSKIEPSFSEPADFFGDWGMGDRHYYCPEMGERGYFSRAFAHGPFRLRPEFEHQKEAISALQDLIYPSDQELQCFDWCDPTLVEVNPTYYAAGAEWWGIFLFTIRIVGQARLWVASASETD